MTSEASMQLDASIATSVAVGLEAALKARSPGVHASTPMVRQLTVRVSRLLGLDDRAQALGDLSAQVRDVGMIGLPDSVVLATGSLAPEDWEKLNRHPVLGARLLEAIPAVAPTARVVQAHHERWDGQGYPDGLQGDAIPLLGRVIATCDAFVAIATDRPHRQGIGVEAALDYVAHERGSQFDPRIADALQSAISGEPGVREPGRRSAAELDSPRSGPRGSCSTGDQRDLREAIAEFDVIPAFGLAVERVLSAAATDSSDRGDIVAAVESDMGLTIAVMRRANAAGRRPSVSVSDAVARLSSSDIREAAECLPRADFPWRTAFEALMHDARVHAQAVARAADRIGRAVNLHSADDLLLAALLHDVGKLVLNRAHGADSDETTTRTTTPERRLRQEQQAFGTDHASLGGLLMTRWGLPAPLAQIVSAHHRATAETDVATFVRLADMVAHHAQGDAVDRRVMLTLAHACGLPIKALRDVLFDLPHASGSQRRRAEASPLSKRETTVLRLLADGKRSKQIASELEVSVSTVRTHLQNSYSKLRVVDRAQAVLRATEMAWI